ncbi:MULTISPECIES: DUF475 domain-containing protein [unclassified Cryobacterium]|uniref:DUF475 domain-containing protein n=1 Tax=unclassified Cryobacterium TaxID=2649013 RepID=UPI001068DCF3|nr:MULTISPECIES: DUF475 domain-containing protein [unclassified Cryobacterium]TFC51137.1 DUF475 domain-containing protein [Cryobacterium sp. TMB3-1-2]TFC74483.1 DUF475 domain-containing protein [Cryobacterium sp. TMB3-15]TFC79996.1 DUF475 domain-containing protein [Cryobacterium sp. TMB3-10]TFD41897.1 DUF475 domain-containing protein [Cryobacterium sp. TMB3-12]
MKTFFHHFSWSLIVSLIALVIALVYGGWAAVALCVILGLMEISLSFDNAVVNARVLEKMSEFWQKIFLTIGILIAVVGMRLIMPLILVSATTGLSFGEVITLALQKGDPATVGTYGHYLHDAHPQIAAFGGMFLLMLFLDFIFEERDITWLSWLEKPLARVGKLDSLSYVVALAALLGGAAIADDASVVLVAGVLGLITYVLVNGLGSLFEGSDAAEAVSNTTRGGASTLAVLTGRAAFFSFLYLEVLDASFSFDGVIGAFAITADPIIILLGLGLIGAMFVRSLTIFLVRQGTLNDYIYLDHGAHWAIGALAGILLLSIGFEIPEIVTGLIGVFLICAAFLSSVLVNRRESAETLVKAPELVDSP